MSTPVCYESVQQPAAKKGKGCEENTPVAPEKKKTPAKTKKSMAKGKTPANKPQQVPTKEKTPAKKMVQDGAGLHGNEKFSLYFLF
jgi:hypothetical protein